MSKRLKRPARRASASARVRKVAEQLAEVMTEERRLSDVLDRIRFVRGQLLAELVAQTGQASKGRR